MNYQNFNAKTIDSWCDSGWEWGKSITHEEYENAKKGNLTVYSKIFLDLLTTLGYTQYSG